MQLAWLLVHGDIVPSQTFSFRRAVEDALDLALVRSRFESELARVNTETDKLRTLREKWWASSPRPLQCHMAGGKFLEVEKLHYRRGRSELQVSRLSLETGKIYAVTGGNGSGKSTFFRILRSCSSSSDPVPLSTTNIRLVDPHLTRIRMPSEQVVEVTQNTYWPLFAKPMDWFAGANGAVATDAMRDRVLTLLQLLEFDMNAHAKRGSIGEENGVTNHSRPDDTLAETLSQSQRDWSEPILTQQCYVIFLMTVALVRADIPMLNVS